MLKAKGGSIIEILLEIYRSVLCLENDKKSLMDYATC